MASPEREDYERNPYLLMINHNTWINSPIYKEGTLVRLSQSSFKLLYGTNGNYSAWVLIEKDSQGWRYAPLGDWNFASNHFEYLGPLLDDALMGMMHSKL